VYEKGRDHMGLSLVTKVAALNLHMNMSKSVSDIYVSLKNPTQCRLYEASSHLLGTRPSRYQYCDPEKNDEVILQNINVKSEN
jgi:hypothetical protein